MQSIDVWNEHNWTLARRASLSAIDASLRAGGWAVDLDSKGATYYRPDDLKVVGFHLPRRVDDEGALQLFNAARWVGEYEKRAADDVLNEWAAPPCDRVKFRLIAPGTEDGVLPLSFSRALVCGLSASLACAVKDVEAPARFHQRAWSALIDELETRALFEQTRRGSFVASVRVPIDARADEGAFDEVKPRLFRRAIEHLTTAVAAVEREDAPASVGADDAFPASANLLDAVLNASCDGRADLEIGVDWSPVLPATAAAPSTAWVKKERADALRAWVQALRPQPVEQTREFFAVVVALAATSSKGAPLEGRVVLRVDDDENEPFEAETPLPPDYFKIACDAFYPGDELTFKARAVRQGGKAVLYDLVNLRRA